MTVDLANFASLLEIGFAVHLAVALLERIYTRELPVRIEEIAGRINALERFRTEIEWAVLKRERSGQDFELALAHRSIRNPAWIGRNDGLLDHLYGLKHHATRRLGGLRRVLSLLMVLSVGVAFYSVALLFLIGLEVETVQALAPLRASLLVLAQLLPLPIAAACFYYIARRMSREVDRKLRGAGELRMMLKTGEGKDDMDYVSVEEIYRRDRARPS